VDPGPIGAAANSGRWALPARSPARSVALATAAEIEKINAVASLVEWRFEDGLQRFLESRMGIKGGKVRTAEEAYRAIEGLKKMFEKRDEEGLRPGLVEPAL